MEVLAAGAWRRRAAAHERRVDALVAPHLERRRTQARHPVHDFLFTYYSHRPAQLRRWHPGYGVGLVDGAPARGYGVVCPSPSRGRGSDARPVVVGVMPEHVAQQRPLIEALHRVLTATAGRAADFGCFGLHEWAMVYRLEEPQRRHADWPLRLGRAGTDRVVDSHRIRCSHFDAYRFFTEQARPLNTLSPGPDDRPAFEQPGCLHAGMDLYKHAYRLSPMIRSELVVDCFELARDMRVLDMRASPYDLEGLGLEPVRIETPAGKQEYASLQRELAARGRPLRQRLIDECERLLRDAAGGARLG